MQYLGKLLARKATKGGRGRAAAGKAMAVKLVQDFMAPQSGNAEDEAERRKRYRGMVIASRMAAIVHAPMDTGAAMLVSAAGDGKCVRLLCRLCQFVFVSGDT